MFRANSPYEELVNKTTSELLTSENWELILEVCDRVGTSESNAAECFNAINKRLLHRNANVVLYTLSLVEAMLKNCGQNVKQEVASRAFTTTLTRVLNDKSVHDTVKNRVLGDIQQWAFEFRQDPTLSLMEETYTKLRAQRFHFPSPQKPEKLPKQGELERQKEEDDLQLALALSLSSINSSGARANYQSPAAIRSEITRQQTIVSSGSGSRAGVTRRSTRIASGGDGASPKKIQVKALFDFTPTEQGELGFYKGDVIDVLDQKYRDWWKGELRGKNGIFPANFVQPLGDIRAEVAKDIDAEAEVFNEAHNIEALLRMLGSIDPMKDNVSDNEDVQKLYSSTLSLRPKIIKLIEKYTKKKEELQQLNNQFSGAMRLYDDLMQHSANQPAPYGGNIPQQQQQQQYQQPQQIQQQQPQQIQQQQPQQIPIQPQVQAQYSGGSGSYSAYDLRQQSQVAVSSAAGLSYSQPMIVPQHSAAQSAHVIAQHQQPQGVYGSQQGGGGYAVASQAPPATIQQPVYYQHQQPQVQSQTNTSAAPQAQVQPQVQPQQQQQQQYQPQQQRPQQFQPQVYQQQYQQPNQGAGGYQG